jgi:hypothetical protein
METVKKDFLADVMNALRLAGLPLTKAGLLKNMGMSKYGVDVKLDEALVELRADGRVSVVDEWGTPLYAATSVLNAPSKAAEPTEIELAYAKATALSERKAEEERVKKEGEARLLAAHVALMDELDLLHHRTSQVELPELPVHPGPTGGVNDKVAYMLGLVFFYQEAYGELLNQLSDWLLRFEADPLAKGQSNVRLDAITDFKACMSAPLRAYTKIPFVSKTVDASNAVALKAALARLDDLAQWAELYGIRVESLKQQPDGLRAMFKSFQAERKLNERPRYSVHGAFENIQNRWASWLNPFVSYK